MKQYSIPRQFINYLDRRTNILYLRFDALYARFKAFGVFVALLTIVVLVDMAFYSFVNIEHHYLLSKLFAHGQTIAMDFAPEVWLGLLGLVLGTLIIVISIASQSTPKLIDLYIGDPTSLFYIWFITSGAVHNVFLQLYASNQNFLRETSILLNTYIMLPLGILFAIPYVLYILRYTKTSNVINKIYSDSLSLMQRLSHPSSFSILNNHRLVEGYQYRLFESLNQLDDLLEYVTFKEPKGDIINKISSLVQYYITIKRKLNPEFFVLSPTIRADISFKTMTAQFDQVQATKTFYEQKVFRLMGNAYLNMIGRGDFDLASLVAFELSECGKVAIVRNDKHLANVIVIRFNTLTRFAIKHGIRHSEARNLYNLVYHYSEFITCLIDNREAKLIKQACGYIKIYGSEIFRHSKNESSFAFLVDVYALEMKNILIRMHQKNIPPHLQKEVLGLFLQMDNLPDFDRVDLGQKRLLNDGVRVLQTALALFYLKNENKEFADLIIADIIEDDRIMGREMLITAMENTCSRLENSSASFWEDTDRGSANIYYSPDADFVQVFYRAFVNKIAEVDANRLALTQTEELYNKPTPEEPKPKPLPKPRAPRRTKPKTDE